MVYLPQQQANLLSIGDSIQLVVTPLAVEQTFRVERISPELVPPPQSLRANYRAFKGLVRVRAVPVDSASDLSRWIGAELALPRFAYRLRPSHHGSYKPLSLSRPPLKPNKRIDMRLLFVDNDALSARRLHGEFLDYRGVNWSLTHCHDAQAAIKHWEQDSFQCLLLRTSAGLDQATLELSELMQTANCPPILAISDNLTNDEQLQLMIRGADDCLHRGESNGASIMRHLRMVELRSTVWSQQANQLQDCDWKSLPPSWPVPPAVIKHAATTARASATVCASLMLVMAIRF